MGTLEETIEMITWQQLGYHSKPVGLLNVDGFYDSLLRFFDDCIDTGFIRAESRGRVLCSADLDDLLSQLAGDPRPHHGRHRREREREHAARPDPELEPDAERHPPRSSEPWRRTAAQPRVRPPGRRRGRDGDGGA